MLGSAPSRGRGGSELGKGGGGREKNIRGKGERSEEYEKREELAIGNKKGRENIYIYIYIYVCVCARAFCSTNVTHFAIF